MRLSSSSRGPLSAANNADPGEDPDTSATPTLSVPLPNSFVMLKVKEAFSADPALKNAPIVIDVYDGVVYLTGIVRTQHQQIIAIYVTGGVKGVHAISNRIQIVPPRRQADS